jgi:hypothetical protein
MARKRRKNRGWFTKDDPRRHVGFSKEACQKGYQTAKAKCDALSPRVSAWFWRLIRGYYRKKRREAPGEPPPHVGPAAHEEPPF